MTGLDLPDTSYTASIAAMNAMYIRSSKIYTNITVNTSTPTVVGKYMWVSDRTLSEKKIRELR